MRAREGKNEKEGGKERGRRGGRGERERGGGEEEQGIGGAAGKSARARQTCLINDSLKEGTATHCNTLQHTFSMNGSFEYGHCNTLQYTATHCNTLQHTATHLLDKGFFESGQFDME